MIGLVGAQEKGSAVAFRRVLDLSGTTATFFLFSHPSFHHYKKKFG